MLTLDCGNIATGRDGSQSASLRTRCSHSVYQRRNPAGQVSIRVPADKVLTRLRVIATGDHVSQSASLRTRCSHLERRPPVRARVSQSASLRTRCSHAGRASSRMLRACCLNPRPCGQGAHTRLDRLRRGRPVSIRVPADKVLTPDNSTWLGIDLRLNPRPCGQGAHTRGILKTAAWRRSLNPRPCGQGAHTEAIASVIGIAGSQSASLRTRCSHWRKKALGIEHTRPCLNPRPCGQGAHTCRKISRARFGSLSQSASLRTRCSHRYWWHSSVWRCVSIRVPADKVLTLPTY